MKQQISPLGQLQLVPQPSSPPPQLGQPLEAQSQAPLPAAQNSLGLPGQLDDAQQLPPRHSPLLLHCAFDEHGCPTVEQVL